MCLRPDCTAEERTACEQQLRGFFRLRFGPDGPIEELIQGTWLLLDSQAQGNATKDCISLLHWCAVHVAGAHQPAASGCGLDHACQDYRACFQELLAFFRRWPVCRPHAEDLAQDSLLAAIAHQGWLFDWDYEPAKSCKRLLFFWANIVRQRFVRRLPDPPEEPPPGLADQGIDPEAAAAGDHLLSKFLNPQRRPVHQLIVWCYRWILGYKPNEIARQFSGDTLVQMVERLRFELSKAHGSPPGWIRPLEEALSQPCKSGKDAGANSLRSLLPTENPVRELTLWISKTMTDFGKEIGGNNA